MDEAERGDDDHMILRGSGPADDDVAEVEHVTDDGPAAEVAKLMLDVRQPLAAKRIIPRDPVGRDSGGEGGGADAIQPVSRIPALGTEARAHQRAGARRDIDAF